MRCALLQRFGFCLTGRLFDSRGVGCVFGKEASRRVNEAKTALKEVKKAIRRSFMGPANCFYKIAKEGGEAAGLLADHVENGRIILDPENFACLPHCIQEYEKCLRRGTVAFQTWKGKLRERVEKGELPTSIRAAIENDEFDVLDVFYDMKAHSIKEATKEQSEKFAEALESVPQQALSGVLRLYNYLAFQKGELGCDNLDDLLIDISSRAQPRDLFLLGASSRARAYLDDTYERMMSKNRWAYRGKEGRPWYQLKDNESLKAEERGLVPKTKYYLTDDQFKMFALLIAVWDRKKHIITDMPALNNREFRHSFVDASGGTLALENNRDLLAAADVARNSFSDLVGAGCPFERTLVGTTVAVDVDTDVGVTHVGGDSITTTDANEVRGLASMSLDAAPGTHGHSDLSRGEDASSLPSTSMGKADARREANASGARPRSHSDHGVAAAGPPDLVSWVAAPGRGASTSAASSSAAPAPAADPGGPSYEGNVAMVERSNAF